MKSIKKSQVIIDGELLDEYWYDIQGYNNYSLSNLNRLKRKSYISKRLSWFPERIIKPQICGNVTRYKIYDNNRDRKWVTLNKLISLCM